MIDTFSIVVTHALMLLAAWRLLRRPALDREDDGPAPRFGRRTRSDA